jgi:hypothetical protein
MKNIPQNKIIQTPSHLGLFEQIQPNNLSRDYRDSALNAMNEFRISNEYFNVNNIRKINNEIKQKMKTVIDDEIIHYHMTNVYFNNRTTSSVEELNKILITDINAINKSRISHEKYLRDRSLLYTNLDNPKMTSNKIEKQLPQFKFI